MTLLQGGFFRSVIIVRGGLSRLNTLIEQSLKYSNNAVKCVVVSPMYFSYCILNTASSPDHVNCKCCLVFSVDTVKRLIVLIVMDLTLVPKPGTDEMASDGSICVPEPLQHEDARSWFKRFELCAAANE